MGKVSRRREGAGMETQQNDFPAPGNLSVQFLFLRLFDPGIRRNSQQNDCFRSGIKRLNVIRFFQWPFISRAHFIRTTDQALKNLTRFSVCVNIIKCQHVKSPVQGAEGLYKIAL